MVFEVLDKVVDAFEKLVCCAVCLIIMLSIASVTFLVLWLRS